MSKCSRIFSVLIPPKLTAKEIADLTNLSVKEILHTIEVNPDEFVIHETINETTKYSLSTIYKPEENLPNENKTTQYSQHCI